MSVHCSELPHSGMNTNSNSGASDPNFVFLAQDLSQPSMTMQLANFVSSVEMTFIPLMSRLDPLKVQFKETTSESPSQMD